MKMSVFKTNTALAVVASHSDSGPLARLLSLARTLVMDAVAPRSRRIYAGAIDEFVSWAVEGNMPLTKATVQQFRTHLETQGLAASTINVRLSAVRRLAAEAADNGLLEGYIAAGIARAKGVRSAGVRTGNWL